jgi:uncharacterized protein (UPF0335 family)
MAKDKKVKVEFNQDEHGSTLAQYIKNASDVKIKIEAYNDEIKDIKDRAKEELGVDGKMFNQVFSLYHKGTRERFEDEKTEVVELYDTIFN